MLTPGDFTSDTTEADDQEPILNRNTSGTQGEFKMSTFYDGSSNNGVRTILTEGAFQAAVLLLEYRSGLNKDVNPDEQSAILAAGTFTFISVMGPSTRNRVTGTSDQLQEWIKGHELRENRVLMGGALNAADGTRVGSNLVSVGNYVPFSGGNLFLREADLPYIRTIEDINAAFGLELVY